MRKIKYYIKLLREIRNPIKIFRRLLTVEFPSIDNFLQDQKHLFTLDTNLPATNLNDDTLWGQYSKEIINELRDSPSGFLRAPVISKTIHPNVQALAFNYLSQLSKDRFFRQEVLTKIYELPFGDPYICSFFPFASPLTIQHLHHLFLIKKHFGFFLPTSQIKNVYEIGAGYGNFYRLMHQYGYRENYMIVDLPSMFNLQKHYLQHAVPQYDTHIRFLITDDLDTLKIVSPSFLIATFSLGEMPMNRRKQIENKIVNVDYFFLAYNSYFDGIDNKKYFIDLEKKLNGTFKMILIKDQFMQAWFLLGEKIL